MPDFLKQTLCEFSDTYMKPYQNIESRDSEFRFFVYVFQIISGLATNFEFEVSRIF